MSVQYIIYNKPLSKKQILEQTDLIIQTHKDSDWIINPHMVFSNLRISQSHEDEIYELENHGYKNVIYIMDTLVAKFNTTFYTDNELEAYWHDKDAYNIEDGVIEAMKYTFNYDVKDVSAGVVIIPERTKEELFNNLNK